MNVAALQTALTLRERARDAAAEAVAGCIAAHEQARTAAVAADGRIAQEMNAAISLNAGDGAVEAFAAWLPLGRHHAALAEERAREVEASLTVARAGLAVARAGVEAIETLLTRAGQQASQRRARVERVAAEDAMAQAVSDDDPMT